MTVTLPLVLLKRLRQGAAEAVEAHVRLAASAPSGDELRAAVTSALVGDLRPGDRMVVRWLLEQETAALSVGGGSLESRDRLVAALARFGQPSDALTLWRARGQASDTSVGVDAEQFARAGFAETRAWLADRARNAGRAGGRGSVRCPHMAG